jgi:hypothetical protein
MKGDTEARGASRRCRPSMPEPGGRFLENEIQIF